MTLFVSICNYLMTIISLVDRKGEYLENIWGQIFILDLTKFLFFLLAPKDSWLFLSNQEEDSS